MSNSVRHHRRQPTRLPCPWDSPGKNTGVGCHFLLQCMKVKSESEVTQSRLTLATLWTAAHQAPPSMGFSRQEYWSGVPWPSPFLDSSTVIFLYLVIFTCLQASDFLYILSPFSNYPQQWVALNHLICYYQKEMFPIVTFSLTYTDFKMFQFKF